VHPKEVCRVAWVWFNKLMLTREMHASVIQTANDRGNKNTSNDVEFPSCRSRTHCAPSLEGRLGGTACRHVLEVEYEYGVVPRFLRADSDAVSPTYVVVDDMRRVQIHDKSRARC
jgi:hypothetical protein